MAAKSKGRHKVGSRTGLERPMTARYGKVVVKIWQLVLFPAVGPLRALERVRNKRRVRILIGLLPDEGWSRTKFEDGSSGAFLAGST
jgi:hypothetical protein